jgi:DHA1 family tetracycline resistance protein-like MFS transporter
MAMFKLLRALLGGKLDPASRLLVGQLVMFAGIAAIFPIAPLYVKQHGGGSVAIGLFIAGPMVANTIAQVPSGALVDRIGRKPVLIGSRLLYALLSLGLFANLGPLWVLALLRIGQGFTGGAYVPALRAALADTTPPGQRGQRYAQLQAVEMVGLLVGPVVGGAVALWSFSAIFLCAGLASLVGVSALFRLPETRATRHEQEEPPRPGWWRRRAVIVPSLALAASGALFSMYDVVWPQYLSARHYGPFVIGVSIGVFAIPVLLLATRAGKFSDRSDRRLLIGAALFIVAACAFVYPFLRWLPVILVVGTVEAVGFTLLEPSLFAVVSESTAAEIRGRAMGMGGFFEFGGGAIGAGVLGSLYGVSERIPFWGGALACIGAAAMSLLFLPRRRIRGSTSDALPLAPVMDLEEQS